MNTFINWILKHKYFFWIIYFLVLFVNGIIFLDPDFGWRLRTGQLILTEGIPKTDPYTYTMPSYPWVNHAWLTDVFIASFYPVIGKAGLSLFFSLLIISALYISYKIIFQKKKESLIKKTSLGANFLYVSFPLLLLSAASFFRFAGIRAQIISWVFTAIIVKFIFNKNLWEKYRHFLPPLFVLWVNLHGGFAAGLVIISLLVIYRIFNQKKLDLTDLFVLTLSLLCTVINPFGLGIYREIWLTISDKTNHGEILEWNSALRTFDISTLILIAFSTTLVFIFRKKLPLFVVVVFFILFYGALSAVRQIPLWVLVALPLTGMAVYQFFVSLNRNKESERRFHQIYKGFYVLSVVAFMVNVAMSILGMIYYSEKNFYPKDAVSYLKGVKPQGEVFSRYDWGGYLIWQYPEKKVYIDGRMPFWKRQNARESETNNSIKDFLDITRGKKDYKSEFEKYNVTNVLWLKPKPPDPFTALDERLYPKLKSFYKIFNYEKTDFSLLETLEKDGWVKIYEDNLAVIYQKPS